MFPENLFDLKDRVAIVTGGSKGIGAALSLDLAKAGAHVAVVSRNLAEAETVVQQIRGFGRKSMAVKADICNVREIQAMVDQVVQNFHRIDILVNNAGTNIRKRAEDLLEEDWDTIVDTNLKGSFFCAQAVGKIMIRQKGGKIINISSTGAVNGVPWLCAYGACKAGVIQMTRVLALEWAKHHIHVNCIAPSYIRTSLTASWLDDPHRSSIIMERIPLKMIGEPKDLTGVLLLLASDASRYITGQTFFVDPGTMAGWAIEW
jgi:NAD(P)-dependent dehydrogenase (short-subunit alcohol dehydrogenase family)